MHTRWILCRVSLRFVAFVFLAFSLQSVFAAKRGPSKRQGVAVLPFQNNTKNKGLDFLSQSLADAVATPVSKDKNIRLVERTQLKAVLKEIELQQSGLFDESAVHLPTGKIPADVLIVGSYTGSSTDIAVTIRAIEVQTASVVAMRRASGSIDTIFGQVEGLVPEFLALLSGGSVAELTVISVPEGAAVYLDGNFVGETPLVSLKTVEGHHELRLIKKKYKDVEQKLDIVAEEKRKVDVFLVETLYMNRPYVDIGGYWFLPFKSFTSSGPIGTFGIGHSFRQFLVKFEFAAPALVSYKYSYKVPYGTLEDSRDYAFYMFHVGFNWHFWDSSSVAPYIGLQAGYTRILENGINKNLYSYDNTRRLIHAPTVIAVAGLDFFPTSVFVLFIEGRYYQSIIGLERNEVESISFVGTTQVANKPFFIQAFAIGAGFRVRF